MGKGQNESLPFYSPKPKLSFLIYASTTPHVAPCMAFPKECLFIMYLDVNLDAKNYGCDDSSWLSPCHDDITTGVTQYMAIKFISKIPKFVLARRRRRRVMIIMMKRRVWIGECVTIIRMPRKWCTMRWHSQINLDFIHIIKFHPFYLYHSCH